MRNGLIQFADLEDFVQESDFQEFDCVRVETIRHTQSTAYNGMIHTDVWAVSVRALGENGDRYGVFIPAYRAQIMSDMDEGKEARGWEKANELKQKVITYLDTNGADVRPGIIHINQNELLYGGWKNAPE